jgi:hypothetical protein
MNHRRAMQGQPEDRGGPGSLRQGRGGHFGEANQGITNRENRMQHPSKLLKDLRQNEVLFIGHGASTMFNRLSLAPHIHL